jgi:hypothetical protein
MITKSPENLSRRDSDRHIIIKPEPRHYRPIKPVAVPEGGATIFFVLAALTAMGWAVCKRYGARFAQNPVARG